MTEPPGQTPPSYPQHGYPQGHPQPDHPPAGPQQRFSPYGQGPPGYPPPGGAAPAPLPPAAFTSRYRRTAWWLIWVPVGLMVGAALLSVALLAYADSDTDNAAAGYLALVVWAGMLFGGPLLLGAFIPGCVMLSRSNRARAVLRTTGYGPSV